MLNGQLREIYAAAGVEKRPNAPDRDLLCRWAGEMGMTQELIVQAAEYARGAGSPMMLIGRILRDWSRAGISTLEAARQEHESHIQGIAQKRRFCRRLKSRTLCCAIRRKNAAQHTALPS